MEIMKLNKKCSRDFFRQRPLCVLGLARCARKPPCFMGAFRLHKLVASRSLGVARMLASFCDRLPGGIKHPRAERKVVTCSDLAQGSTLPCEDWRAGYVETMVQGFLWILLFSSTLVYAVYTPMPWEGPICAVASSLKGQVAVVLSVVATIMIGIMFMYAETGGIVARIASWLLGMSCALSVVSIITALFPGVAIPGCL